MAPQIDPLDPVEADDHSAEEHTAAYLSWLMGWSDSPWPVGSDLATAL